MKIRAKPIKLIITILILLISMSFRFPSRAEPANDTVEGEGNHYVTGQSYPSKIVFAGYDVINKKMYINYELTTTKTVPSVPTNINYYIEVFNDSSTRIGNVGSYIAPEAGTLTTGVLSETNQEISLGSNSLTAKYSLVITVKSTN